MDLTRFVKALDSLIVKLAVAVFHLSKSVLLKRRNFVRHNNQ